MNIELFVELEEVAWMGARGAISALEYPSTVSIDLLRVLHALSDPTRMQIVCMLHAEGERACGTFPVDVAPSTLSHHFKVLRESGVIHQRVEGRERMTALRTADLEDRFPGLVASLVNFYSA